jgi:hypothetical protein
VSVLVLVVDDEPDVEGLFRQQFRGATCVRNASSPSAERNSKLS